MFLVNSRQGSCAAPVTTLASHNGKPYCERTAAVLPSSLTRVLPITLMHLHPSTCVGFRYDRPYRKSYYTFPGTFFPYRGLSRSSRSPETLHCYPPKRKPPGFTKAVQLHVPRRNKSYVLTRCDDSSCYTNYIVGAGILTCCPSPTPFGLSLGSTNPGMIDIAQETLDLR